MLRRKSDATILATLREIHGKSSDGREDWEMRLQSDELTLLLSQKMVSDQLKTTLLTSDGESTVARLFQELIAVVVRVKNR